MLTYKHSALDFHTIRKCLFIWCYCNGFRQQKCRLHWIIPFYWYPSVVKHMLQKKIFFCRFERKSHTYWTNDTNLLAHLQEDIGALQRTKNNAITLKLITHAPEIKKYKLHWSPKLFKFKFYGVFRISILLTRSFHYFISMDCLCDRTAYKNECAIPRNERTRKKTNNAMYPNHVRLIAHLKIV